MEEIMNTDKGTIVGETAKYRLIDLFTDLAGRMHTYGTDAVVTFTSIGWRVEDRKAKPTERRLIGVVSDLVEALKGNSPDSEVTFDSRGWMNLA
jgi:hypothetical protein